MRDVVHPASERLDEAIKAVERGWVLVPLRGKKPIQKGWTSATPSSMQQVVAWAKQGNVGLRTGAVSQLVVLDDDSNGGVAAQSFDLPKTVTVITGSGKRHYYFRAPEVPIRNSAGTLGKHLDVRGDGGQVVLPGSLHPDTNEPYRWAPGLSPDEVDLASLPEHILHRLRSARKKSARGSRIAPSSKAKATKYAAGALKSAVANISGAEEGERNETLNRESFGLGQLVGAGALDSDTVIPELIGAAQIVGLGHLEAMSTIKSGLEAGAREPRNVQLHEARSHPRANGVDAGGPSKRPSIEIEGGELPRMVMEAEDLLLHQRDSQVFQRGGILVRIVKLPEKSKGTPRVVISELNVPFLVNLLTTHADWLRWDGRSKEHRRVDCPEKVARTLLNLSGAWKAPALHGLILSPTLRSDGTVLDRAGYDPGTGLYLLPSGCRFDPVPEKPNHGDAIRALEVLAEPLKDFPWVADSDKCTALAAILTALVRPVLRTAPLFAFRAPKMGSGKSLLTDVVSMIATGRTAHAMTQGQDENEDRKRMLAILMEGEPVACIDNVERPLGGAALCSVLTQQIWRDRILGKSETVSVPTTNTTWLATGNNLQFTGDVTTRVLVCDLDPACEKPEERSFDVDLYKLVPERRGSLVTAALTILRAYHVAGRPDQELRVFGRFESWSSWIRSALVWCGQVDPCEGRRRIEATDPVRDQLSTLLTTWPQTADAGPLTVADVIQRARKARGQLQDLLIEVAGDDKGGINSRRFGKWLARYERRPERGRRLERAGDRQGVALWRVSHV